MGLGYWEEETERVKKSREGDGMYLYGKGDGMYIIGWQKSGVDISPQASMMDFA